MKNLQLTLACGRYGPTEALFTGGISPPGIDLTCLDVWPHETFQRMSRFQEFDVSEMSLSSYLIARSRGEPPLIAIPAFICRGFRHSTIWVRDDVGLSSPADLKGKRIGVPEYQMTNSLWMRGILNDMYGVKAEDVLWVQGGLEDPGRTERLAIQVPPQIRLVHEASRSLSQLIAAGEIDGIISARMPLIQKRPIPHVCRLFRSFKEEELRYFKTTGIFPIIHTVVLREELYDRFPWIAVSLFRAFEAARKQWIDELRTEGAVRMALPWVNQVIDEVLAEMGESFWTYGLDEGNRLVLETAARYSYEQGLSQRRLKVEELFAPNTLEAIHC